MASDSKECVYCKLSFVLFSGIFQQRVRRGTSGRYGSDPQTAGFDCITDPAAGTLHPDPSTEGTALSDALPPQNGRMFC